MMKSNYEITPQEKAESIKRRLKDLRELKPCQEFTQAIAKVEAERDEFLRHCPEWKEFFN